MLDSLTWSQLMEWFSYSQVEPFGDERADLRMGILASVIANVNRSSKHKPTPYKPADFIPDFSGVRAAKPVTDKSTWERIKATARSMAAAKVMDDASNSTRRRQRQGTSRRYAETTL
jgi:hypothetical protein